MKVEGNPHVSFYEAKGLFLAKQLEVKQHKLFRKYKDRFGKPTKSVKEIRRMWKDEEMNFSEELIKMREE